tara:strand:- start:124 stop:366 length:243 start_codon:yes stop_codon:yes gene_type:complete
MGDFTYFQEIPKHACGNHYEIVEQVICRNDGDPLIVSLHSCDGCGVFEFYGRGFKYLRKANAFIKKNKGRLEKLSLPNFE